MGPSSNLPAAAAPAAGRPVRHDRAGRDRGAARGGPGSGPGLDEQDLLVVAQCLPERMRALDRDGAVLVAGLLRERLDAGWRPAEIRALMDQDLPERVGRLSSLVASRLKRNIDPMTAPLGDSEMTRAAEESRQEASRLRSVELAGGTPRRGEGTDDRWAWEQVRQRMPDASPLEQAMAVVELLDGGEAVAS